MKVELSRFRIKPDKIARCDEWLKLLQERHAECVATLDREKMYVEVIFRERYQGEDYLNWFTIQDETGEALETSPFEIDHIHRAFGGECIDTSFGAVEPAPQMILIAPFISAAMGWTTPQHAAEAWTGGQTWRSIKPKDVS